MNILKVGSQGAEVTAWQYFLIGKGFYQGQADGDFGPKTLAATQAFQSQNGLHPDGVAGNRTLGIAMQQGFGLLQDPSVDKSGSNWPPKPTQFSPILNKDEVFGKIEFVPNPTADNPEGIKITNNWDKTHIETFDVPQLTKIKGSAKVTFHKAAKPQMIKLWKDWEDAELLHLVLTWAGTWNPRFIRGSRSVLSQHAYGTAFDINVEWNKLGAVPALVGQKGSVRELVKIAQENGFYWGGFFSRLDGMHFEVYKLIS
ncbi:MAG: peptidoglycan-binding protein [Sphingobacteriia bacterium]|nr:peptidoglycan-binding protein [Sphingobacteriia bacterium]